jgi:hypothetical protein
MMRRLNTAALSRPLVTVSQLPERALRIPEMRQLEATPRGR